ncbi:MAG TPA: hypothetical protein DIT40_07680 [Alphaproteobacteria bacterium]|nr:hypothetical protein [Alphaproteobacteria bacterium]
MLSRTADNLYWLSRYMERAENLARILDVGLRMSLLPHLEGGAVSEWRSTLAAAGGLAGFDAHYDETTAQNVVEYLAFDTENSSSIRSCIKVARENGRAVRTALTGDMWESLNATWLELADIHPQNLERSEIAAFLDWVKERSLQFRGSTYGSMLRNDGFFFTRLGTFIERGDNTARILDVKYHVLLPQTERVGGSLDHYQWAAILRSVSALGSYHWLYRDNLKPWQIAELLILRPEMPRSLSACLAEVNNYLDRLSSAYGASGETQRLAGQLHAELRYGRIDQIFQSGLHEFLTDFIGKNIHLSSEISTQYLIG